MGWYGRYIFPRLLDLSLGGASISRYRKEVLAEVKGEILELGFGTGLNLCCYPAHIGKIVTVDANEGMNSRAARRMAQSTIKVEHHVLDAERLPFSAESFDSVVSTWTLCSISNIAAALAEVRRVLKPDGRFFFFEHGVSAEAAIEKWQHRLNGINRIFADGCNMDRNISRLIEESGLKIIKLDKFYIKEVPKIYGYMYRGTAMKEGDR